MTGRPLSRRAPDAGFTTAEVVVDMVIVGLLMTAMMTLVVLAMEAFTPVKEADRPAAAAQLKLSRSAVRVLAVENCENPTGVASRSECAAPGGAHFPRPREVPTGAGYPQNTPTNTSTVCWMVEALIGTDAGDTGYRPTGAVPRPDDPTMDYTYRNPDRRDLECWYHDADTGRLLVASHYPQAEDPDGAAAADQDSSDLFEPEWSENAYRVVAAADRIEALHVEDVSGWRCTPGVDIAPPPGLDCNPATWEVTVEGVAVLSVDLCVSLSGAELKRRRTAEKLEAWAGRQGETCEDVRVTASLGRA